MSYESLTEDELITTRLGLQCIIDNIKVSSVIEKATYESEKVDQIISKRILERVKR